MQIERQFSRSRPRKRVKTLELCFSGHQVVANLKDSLVKVVVHSVNVVRIHHCHCFCWNEIPLFADCDSLVLFRNTSVWRNASPVSCLRLTLVL